MVARGLAPPTPSLSVAGGSALTKSCRPVGSETLAIWAPARGVKSIAHSASVPKRSPAVIAVRFTIVSRGRQTPFLQPDQECTVFDISPVGVNVSSVLGAPPQTVYPGGRSPGERFVL